MDHILEFVVRLILAIILLIVFLPIIWMVTGPFILLAAAFAPGPYGYNVNQGFRSVSRVWLNWGILLLP